VEGTLSAAFHGNPVAIIQFGLLLLIATPVARVIFAVFAFALQRDFLYVTISTIVLLTLLYSLIWH
jgi:Predicted membrane protein